MAVTTQRNRIFYWTLYNPSSHSILTIRPKHSNKQKQNNKNHLTMRCVFSCTLCLLLGQNKKASSERLREKKKTEEHSIFSAVFLCNIVQDVVVYLPCLSFYLFFTFFSLSLKILLCFTPRFQCTAIERNAYTNIIFRFHL